MAWFFLFIAFFVLFNSCTQISQDQNKTKMEIDLILEVNATQNLTSNLTEAEEPKVEILNLSCEDVVCGENEVCISGKCFCKENYRSCNDKCISKDSCCTNADCSERANCLNGTCIEILCNYHETFNSASRSCQCDQDSKWCDFLERCIPKNHCCTDIDCNPAPPSLKTCKQYKLAAYVCLKNLEGEVCARAFLNQRNSFSIFEKNYDIFIEAIHDDGAISGYLYLFGKNETFKNLKLSGKIKLLDALIENIKIESFGGHCVG